MKQVFLAPERGDVVLISLPLAGSGGRTAWRPVIVLSPQAYNQRTGLALGCPVSPLVKGYPFEVLVPPGQPVGGVVLADQAVSLDWRASRAEKIGSLPSGVIEECLGKLLALLG